MIKSKSDSSVDNTIEKVEKIVAGEADSSGDITHK